MRAAALIEDFSRGQQLTGIITGVIILAVFATFLLLPKEAVNFSGILWVVGTSLLFTALYYGTSLRNDKRWLLLPDMYYAGTITFALHFLGPYAPYFFFLYFIDLAMDTALYDLPNYRATIGLIMVAIGIGHLFTPTPYTFAGLAILLVQWLAVVLMGSLFWLYASEAARQREERLQAEKEAARFAELERIKSDFLALASHEMRTPLGHIKGYVDLLRGKKSTRSLDRIDANVDRLLHLISQMLAVMKLEEGGAQVERRPVSLGGLIRAVVDEYLPKAKEGKLTITSNLPEDEVQISGSVLELREAITNLFDNAIHYTPAGGTVLINMRVTERSASVEIRDTGIGIPHDEQEHLFDKFFRATNAREVAPSGSGLGLYLAKRLIERHGGTLSIQSNLGQGTTATVSLPVAPPTASRHIQEPVQ